MATQRRYADPLSRATLSAKHRTREPVMSQGMELRHLEEATRHIAEGEQRIAEQKARIARQERDGHDTNASKNLLAVLEETLELMMRHRDLILREIRGQT